MPRSDSTMSSTGGRRRAGFRLGVSTTENAERNGGRRVRLRQYSWLIMLLVASTIAAAPTTAAPMTGSAELPESTLGPWHLVGALSPLAILSGQGVTTDMDGAPIFRGRASIPPDLLLQGWDHIGDPDAHGPYLVDALQGPENSKLFSVTANGARTDYPHPLAEGELMNNSFATISPDGQWLVSGEWETMQRLLVFPMPQLNPAAPTPGQPLPPPLPIELDHPVRDLQGCDFVTATQLLCASNDPTTTLWPTPRPLLQLDLTHPLNGQPVTATVHSLGPLPQQSPCTGEFEVEGINVHNSRMLVGLIAPKPCGSIAATYYEYER